MCNDTNYISIAENQVKMYGVRIVAIDYYMTSPTPDFDITYSDFRGNSVYQVPIIRIFGSSLQGEKTCLHIHRVFPYIYIPYDGSESADALTYQIATSLDKALNVSLGQGSANVNHVHKILLVSGKPLYGYHVREHQFFKIFFYNPMIIKKACTLLENGAILGKCYQPFEAHIPYVLQFMIDYNLHGMSYILLSEIHHRQQHQRISVCQIEADVASDFILNKIDVESPTLAINPGLAFIWDDEKQRRRNNNVDSQVEYSLTQRDCDVSPTKSHLKFQEMLIGKLYVDEHEVAADTQNLSVYPAETPSNRSMLRANNSTISCSSESVPTPHEESSFMDESTVVDADDTILNLLQDLGENREIEEGSILSQTKQTSDTEESDADEADLSLPLLASPSSDTNFPSLDLDFKLPQLDGSCTESPQWKRRACRTAHLSTDNILQFSDLRVVTRYFLNNYLVPKEDFSSCEAPKKLDMPVLYRNGATETINSDGFPAEKPSCVPLKRDSVIRLPKPKEMVRKSVTIRKPPVRKPKRIPREILNRFLHNANVLNLLTKGCRLKFRIVRALRVYEYTKNLSHCVKFESPKSIYYLDVKRNKFFDSEGIVINVVMNGPPLTLNGMTYKPSIQQNNILRILTSKCRVNCNDVTSNEEPFKNMQTPIEEYRNILEKLSVLLEKFNAVKKTLVSHKSLCASHILKVAEQERSKPYENACKAVAIYHERPQQAECHATSETEAVEMFKRVVEKQLRCVDGMNYSSSSENEQEFMENGCKRKVRRKMRKDKTPVKNKSGASQITSGRKRYKSLAINSSTKENVHDSNRSSSSETLDETLVEESVECKFQSKRKPTRKCAPVLLSDFEPQPGTSKTPDEVNFQLSSDSSDECPRVPTPTNSQFGQIWTPKNAPPTHNDLQQTLDVHKIPPIVNAEPFYGNVSDVTGRIEIGHTTLKIPSETTADAQYFHADDGLQELMHAQLHTMYSGKEKPKAELRKVKSLALTERKVVVTPVKRPPTAEEVRKWLCDELKPVVKVEEPRTRKVKIMVPKKFSGDVYDDDSDESILCTMERSLSETLVPDSNESKIDSEKIHELKIVQKSNETNSGEITGVSPNNTFGFEVSLNFRDAKAVKERQFLTILALELHIRTRENLKPDPQIDPIRAIFYTIVNDGSHDKKAGSKRTGMIIVNDVSAISLENISDNCEIKFVDSEKSLIDEFVECVRNWDPDIFAGFEIEMLSWGYLVERCKELKINMLSLLSRIPSLPKSDSSWEGTVPGRIVLDVWRLMRHEIALQSYTFENLVYHILHKRVPLYTSKDLNTWWEHPTSLYRHKTANHYLFRVENVINLLKKQDVIDRTSELARLFGIQFYEVLSRGSQFRVESMMLRLAKPLNFIPVSPSVQQRAHMRAPEFLPLILEPESRFYADPVVVLDFQSLYPSMMLAYNYCFSTCLGRVEHLGQNAPFKFGATQLKVSKQRLKKLLAGNKLNFSPCGVAFVKPEVVQGVLPRMLREILTTRLMVKQSMKDYRDDKTLQCILHSRQLGLKLIANVTYGYTAANFSGRMPCSEVADSVVSKGRETLQRAIDLVDSRSEWGGRVVYGDTDSLFVLLSGKTREEAFKIGSEIAESVTNDNPSPVKLKMEKVYQPCILQTKKRYVGYMYESEDQKEPKFDAKGIETVRRDGCPAASKMLEKCLKMLFDHPDVSILRKYVVRQFDKILSGRVRIQDLIFAKEYRGLSGYRPGACVPALELARKWLTVDKRSEPRRSERVPYVVVAGPPGLPLFRLVRSPYELLHDSNLQPNVLYYVTKVIIPVLNRCLSLIGVDVNLWFNEMPRKSYQYFPTNSPVKRGTISHFFVSASCAVCGCQSQKSLCEQCHKNPQTSYTILCDKWRTWELAHEEVNLMCQVCAGDATGGEDSTIVCRSLDCPVLYKLTQARNDLQQIPFVREVLAMFE